jgi:hypothetical protein
MVFNLQADGERLAGGKVARWSLAVSDRQRPE